MKKIIIAIFITLLFAGSGWAADDLATCQAASEICFCDYSDASSCSGSNWNGYATFTALLAGEDALASDDIVDVGDGAVYREKWTIDGSGTSGHPIIIRARSGESPIISGFDLITGWAGYGGELALNYTTLDADYAPSADAFAIRVVIPADTFADDWTNIRIQIRAHSTAATVVGGTSVGLQDADEDFSGAPTRITWDTGSDGKSIAAGETAWSDWVSFAHTKSNAAVIHIDIYDAVVRAQTRRKTSYIGCWYAVHSDTEIDDELVQDVEYAASSSLYSLQAIEINNGSGTTYFVENIGVDTRTPDRSLTVLVDGTTQLTYNSDKDALVAGEYYHDVSAGDDLYVRLAADADPAGHTIEADVRVASVYATGKDYITLDGLKFTGGLYGTYEFRGNDYWIVKNCTYNYHGSHAIKLEGEGGAGNTNNLYQNIDIQYVGGSGNAGDINPFAIRVDGASNTNTFEYIKTQDIEYGSVFQTDSDSCIYRYNYFESDGSNAFTLTDSGGDGSDSNIVHGNIIISNTGDYGVVLAFWDASTGNMAYNNVIIAGNDYGIDIGATATGSILRNNIVSNTTTAIRVADGGDVDFDSDYNVFYSTVRVGSWKGANQAALTDWQTASSMDDHSFESLPSFLDSGSGDYSLTSGNFLCFAGTSVPGYNTRIDPTSTWPDDVRTMGSTEEIGAYLCYKGARLQ